MSAIDESGGKEPAVLAGDPAVPILDIPPNEDLAVSDETLAAVASMGEVGNAQEEMGAGAEAEAEVGVKDFAMDLDDIPTGEELLMDEFATEGTNLVSEGELNGAVTNLVPEGELNGAVGAPTDLVDTTAMAFTTTLTTTTTRTTTTTETAVLVADLLVDSAAAEEETVLGKREKAEEETAAAEGEGGEESGPPSKKVKAATDEQDGEPAAAAEGEQNGGEVAINPKPVQLGPKTFHSGVEMFTYFYDLLHAWVSNVDVNKYEFLVLSDLITKGHRDAEAKIGPGIQSFQIRFHPGWRSRCYYLIRTDGTVDDFSYRKCVDKIMPLPENLYSPSGDLLVDKLFGPEEDKWSKKSKGKENSGDGWKHNHGGQNHRGGRGGRGDRRGGGRGGFRV